ncbi:type II secretion system protein N [Elongatibacter sediminis]|uniref:Type II secretion system protein N n=1 Tax=Elongatibacter sediminis TaxID=3119006 RepID=A0AAW9R5R6_9GAMM
MRAFLIALCVLVIVTAVFFPATWLITLAARDAPALAVDDVSGPWWNGTARGTRWGELRLGTVRWRLRGIGIDPRLRLQWAISGRGPDYRLDGALATRGGRLDEMRDVRGAIPAAWFAPAGAALALRIEGLIEPDLERVRLDRQSVTTAAGRMHWTGARVSGSMLQANIPAAELGTVVMELHSEDEQTTIMNITTRTPADITLNGSGSIEAGAWQLEILARATGRGHTLLNRLEPYGTRQPGGSLAFRFAGHGGAAQR